jgi:hypothetical protein
VLNAGDKVALECREPPRRWRRQRHRGVGGIEQGLRRAVVLPDQNHLAGRGIGVGQHGRSVDDVASDIAAIEALAKEYAVAVRHERGRTGRTALAIRAGYGDMRADIRDDRRGRSGGDRRIDLIALRIEDCRAGKAIRVAPFQSHFDTDGTVSVQHHPRRREIDLVRPHLAQETEHDA